MENFAPVFDPALLWAIIPLGIWSIIWKGLALWKAARRGDKAWFIIFMILNTAGILEIIYYFFVGGKGSNTCCAPVSENK